AGLQKRDRLCGGKRQYPDLPRGDPERAFLGRVGDEGARRQRHVAPGWQPGRQRYGRLRVERVVRPAERLTEGLRRGVEGENRVVRLRRFLVASSRRRGFSPEVELVVAGSEVQDEHGGVVPAEMGEGRTIACNAS